MLRPFGVLVCGRYKAAKYRVGFVSRETSYKSVCKNSSNLRGRKLGVRPSYKSVLFDDTFLKFYTNCADKVSQQECAMSIED
jgi:hypothetical protein